MCEQTGCLKQHLSFTPAITMKRLLQKNVGKRNIIGLNCFS